MILILVCSCNDVSKVDSDTSKSVIAEKTKYYPSGKLNFKATVINGLQQGYVHEYYENGSIKLKQYWSRGKQLGSTTMFDSVGRIMLKTYTYIDSVSNRLTFLKQTSDILVLNSILLRIIIQVMKFFNP